MGGYVFGGLWIRHESCVWLGVESLPRDHNLLDLWKIIFLSGGSLVTFLITCIYWVTGEKGNLGEFAVCTNWAKSCKMLWASWYRLFIGSQKFVIFFCTIFHEFLTFDPFKNDELYWISLNIVITFGSDLSRSYFPRSCIRNKQRLLEGLHG